MEIQGTKMGQGEVYWKFLAPGHLNRENDMIQAVRWNAVDQQ